MYVHYFAHYVARDIRVDAIRTPSIFLESLYLFQGTVSLCCSNNNS